jgi:hypothetical protein
MAAAGAVTLVALAFSAPADATASKHHASANSTIAYSGTAFASGVHMSIDVSPALLPVSDLFDVQVPQGNSQLTSAGLSSGNSALASPGNSIDGLKLLCSAASQIEGFCEQLNTLTVKTPLGPYPPNSPLTASASYPENNGKPVDAEVSGKQFGSKSAVTFFPGKAQAQATAHEVTTSASGTSAALAHGTPIAVSTGSMSADTHQVVSNGTLVVTANASASNISIGGIVHIKQVTSTASVTDNGHGHIVRHGSTTVSGATALGQPVTITRKGVSIAGHSDGGLLGKTLNTTLQKALAKSGFTIQLVGVHSSRAGRTVTVDTGGLLVNFKHKVSGLPDVSQYLPICIPSKQNCLFSPPNANATYIGIAALGEADVTAYAAPIPPIPKVSQSTPPTSPPAAHKAGTGAGGSGSVGSSGTTLPGTSHVGSGPAAPGAPPTVAGIGKSVNAGDLLTGASHRLTYLFPALLLAAIAGFGGGLSRYPARLPVPSRQ